MSQPEPKFVLVDDDNYRLCDPCDTEEEARAQADFNSECSPVRHVCRVCPACGEHDVSRKSGWAYGLEYSAWHCFDCDWLGNPE